ncbi:TlpA disulfide reductase family protein [Pseudodesulfovibrio sp.]|uniref:peroxiredoxin family protein n=1 Tax=Pseudodesulfovibrio sp. TaxID=2035812 RepID=UPI002634E67E|nr:TlpA disulfide reductase family protein [Pseudodesulfovibrio sp.]MDD3311621.1 TlpA disulfide reductase family protein [Pseudodesulfovibrio sp.]
MFRRLILALFLLMLLAAPAIAGQAFPDLPLTGPLEAGQRSYLGLSGDEVRPSAVGARYVFVEVFSMYCPICQHDAPSVNQLYAKVREAGFGKDMRFIGIGTGNTAFEVNVFREKYAVPFPLFDDPDFTWHKALDEVGTPAFYLVDLEDGRSVRYHHVGALSDVDVLLALLKDLTAR